MTEKTELHDYGIRIGTGLRLGGRDRILFLLIFLFLISSQNRPLWAARAGVILPDALAAEVSVAIVTQLDAWWQLLEQLRVAAAEHDVVDEDRKSTRLNSSHVSISYAVFCLKKKNLQMQHYHIR